jgi:hypothetical protein
MLPGKALSMRWKATSIPLGSTIATFSGMTVLASFTAAAMILLASSIEMTCLCHVLSVQASRFARVSILTCAGVLPMPLVAVLLPAAQAPRDEPKSRVRESKDLMKTMLDVDDV